MNELEKEIKRLSNLKNFKNKTTSEISKIARIGLWKKQLNIKSNYEKDNAKLAEEKLDSYFANYQIETFDQVQNLADLIFEEITKDIIQKSINKILADGTNKFSVAKDLDSLHDVEDRIWKLKEKIGISSNKKKDDFSALQELKNKFKTYISFNRNEFTLYMPYTCSSCKKEDIQPILLRRKVKDFNVLKHPMFSGRFWFNRRGIESVKQGIMTRELYAWLFNTSVQYVDWALENEQTIVKLDDVDQEEIEKFIENNPFLKEQHIPVKLLEIYDKIGDKND